MFKKATRKVINKLRENKGEGLVSAIIIAVMIGIISVGVMTAIKPQVQSTQQKTNTMLQSAGSQFTY